MLDIGCGEGDYTGAFAAVASEVIGLDIARPAIRLAAKRHPAMTWLVGSGAHLPLADASVDAVTNLFTQLHVAEIRRVLRPGGHVLVVTPAARHLWTLREHLFDVVQPHAPDKFMAGFETDFEPVEQQTVSLPLQLSQADVQHLLLMTPYAWKAKPERREAMNAVEAFDTEAAFSLMLFKRNVA